VLAVLAMAIAAAAPAGANGDMAVCRDVAVTWEQAGGDGVVRPADVAGLRLVRLTRPDPRCQAATLDAVWRGPGGVRLRMVQGPPRCCGEGGGAPLAGRPVVRGWSTALYHFGEGPLARTRGWTLYLKRPGAEVALISGGVGRQALVRIARSLAPVPAAAPALTA
jgi:hypothetical protein